MTEVLGLLARLGCVFALLGLVLWLLKRTNGLGVRRRGTPLQVLSTTRLSKSATLSVVRVHDEEYVLGVTGSGVTVVAHRPHAEPAQEPTGGNDGRTDTGAAPPSAAALLRTVRQALRARPAQDTDLSTDAVAAALAQARGEDVPAAPSGPDGADGFAADLAVALAAVPAPTPAERPDTTGPEGTPGNAPFPSAADGSAAPLSRRLRRPRIRTEALHREEQDRWSGTRRPSLRSADEDSVAV